MRSILKSEYSYKERIINSIINTSIYLVPFFFFTKSSTKIIYSAILLMSFLFSSFFWSFFIPIFNFNKIRFLRILHLGIIYQFKRAPSTFFLTSGKFYKDYFLFKKKPIFRSLLIDHLNALAVINRKGEKRILLEGFHNIRPGEKIVHVFNLNNHHFNFGPKIQNFSPQSVSNLQYKEDSKSLIRNSHVSSIIKGRIQDSPLFSIHLKFNLTEDAEQTKIALMYLSDYFSIHHISGDITFQLSNLIGESAYSVWKTLVQEKNINTTCSQEKTSQQISDNAILLLNAYLNHTESNIPGFSEKQFMKPSEIDNLLRNLDLINIRVFINEDMKRRPTNFEYENRDEK